MQTGDQSPEILGVPAYVRSWSVVGLPGFAGAVLARWQRNHGPLPAHFVLVACPQVEVLALGGLPSRVLELTDARRRLQHFTGCHKPYLVLFLMGEQAEVRRAEVQRLLAWSESYHVSCAHGRVRMRFLDAIEECETSAA